MRDCPYLNTRIAAETNSHRGFFIQGKDTISDFIRIQAQTTSYLALEKTIYEEKTLLCIFKFSLNTFYLVDSFDCHNSFTHC